MTGGAAAGHRVVVWTRRDLWVGGHSGPAGLTGYAVARRRVWRLVWRLDVRAGHGRAGVVAMLPCVS